MPYFFIKNKIFHKNLSMIEEIEVEPSLGNGGVERLVACFLDSIVTLGLPGAVIGLNYHLGLFRRTFAQNINIDENSIMIYK